VDSSKSNITEDLKFSHLKSMTSNSSEISLQADSKLSNRIESIDVLRAITMILMIFVNDFWSLKNIPDWLRHVARGVDGIGFSDVIFPAFLFIVGLSLPYAIQNRRSKGDSNFEILKHVLFRTIALLVMGVFLVNGESIHAEATGILAGTWYPMVCLCFILIWNNYSGGMNTILSLILKYSAIVILIVLAFVYRGGEAGDLRFESHWWGILGLIGWAYLVSALITTYSNNNSYILLSGWLFFCVLSIINKAELLPSWGVLNYIPGTIKGGTLAGLTMGGVLASHIFRYYVKKGQHFKLTLIFLSASIILILLSVITRPYWGLAKLGATPAWLFLCSAFTLMAFTVIYWIADVWKKAYSFKLIKPAGTDTLLCYLIPYFIYAVFKWTGFEFPEILSNGWLGLLKSFSFAMLCVFITQGLNASGIRLKI
jgi:predicted acyltransferase